MMVKNTHRLRLLPPCSLARWQWANLQREAMLQTEQQFALRPGGEGLELKCREQAMYSAAVD